MTPEFGNTDVESAAPDVSGGRGNYYRSLYDYFSTAIMNEAIRDGDRLPSERQIMDEFGATRNTVRRALTALEQGGLVVRKRGSGTYASLAKPRSKVALEASKIGPLDVLEIRLILEPGFVDLITARATPDDFERMAACLDKADRAKNQSEFREATLAFRMEAARATRNPLIIQIYEFIMDARKDAGWYLLRKVDESKEAQRKRLQRSRAFLAALRARNKPLAKQLLKARLSMMVAEVTGAAVDEPAPAEPPSHTSED
jgi:DNA-binding FadR family transcriptional regulator